NELSPALIDELMRTGKLPTFARFFAQSQVFTTDAGEKPPNLEPWIQWPTVHSGLPFSDHGIFSLGTGYRLHRKMVGELLSDQGIAVGLFSPMNGNYATRNVLGYVIPDPWDGIGQAHPRSLQPYYQTISDQVQESAAGGAFTPRTALRLSWFLARHGVSANTIASAISQIVRERAEPGTVWRRAL